MYKIVKIFGVVLAEDGTSLNLDGEIVKYNTDKQLFSLNGKNYKAHPKQTEEVSLLYPNVIWVSEPNVHSEDPDEVVVNRTDISNCYARRGSHWIKYIIDPDSLTMVGEDDEAQAQLKALEFADIIVSKEKLIEALNKSGITDKSIVDNILENL